MIEFKLSRYIDNFAATADEIADYVQTHGGTFSTHKHYVEFRIPIKESLFLAMKYSQLEMEAYVW